MKLSWASLTNSPKKLMLQRMKTTERRRKEDSHSLEVCSLPSVPLLFIERSLFLFVTLKEVCLLVMMWVYCRVRGLRGPRKVIVVAKICSHEMRNGFVKIQQPVTTSTYTKYGQRFWRQPETKTQKHKETLTNVTATLFTTNTEDTCR